MIPHVIAANGESRIGNEKRSQTKPLYPIRQGIRDQSSRAGLDVIVDHLGDSELLLLQFWITANNCSTNARSSSAASYAVLPGFEPTDDDHALIGRLCRYLDGLPLAIELAALGMRALPLAQIAQQLGQSRPSVPSRRQAPGGTRRCAT